jgi:HEPN domain-containing protein
MTINLHRDDAARFLMTVLRERPENVRSNGNDVWIPKVAEEYLREISDKPIAVNDSTTLDFYPLFHDAAWDLARRRVLRLSEIYPNVPLGPRVSRGAGYCLTEAGRARLVDLVDQSWVPVDPSRYSEALKRFVVNFGSGFERRAYEAARSYDSGNYLACCAMCGAAAESILLAVAIAKSGDEGITLSTYRTASGRRKVVDSVVGQTGQTIAEAFRSATGLLSYWRDEASHGMASTISEIEAHEGLARLLRFAQFAADHWVELTRPR